MADNSSARAFGRAREPVIIIGGGVVGMSVAYHLRDEMEVALLEKSMLGSGTTAASIAQFTQHQDDPDTEEAERRRRSWAFYKSLVDDGAFGFDRIGTLHVASNDKELAAIEETPTSLERAGITATMVMPAELSRYGIDPETVCGGFFLPDDGVLDPGEIVQYFATEAQTSGVTVETGTAVTGVTVDQGRVTGVETTEGTYEAGTVVNAAGPWAPRIDEMVGISKPLRHTYGPILVLQSDADVTLPLTLFESGYYVREEGDCQLLAGKFATTYKEATMLDPDGSHAAAAGEQFRLEIAELLSTHMPSYAALDVTNSWVGLRTVTPDGRPLVGATDVEGYFHATGMSGYGITLAPVVGELLAERLTTGDVPRLLESLAPSRFDG